MENSTPTSVERTLGRLEGGVQGLHDKIDALDRKTGGFDARLQKVERRQSYELGWLAGGAGIAGVVLSILLKLWK